MSADYDALKRYLETPPWVWWPPTGVVPTYIPNPGEDLDALGQQAEEGARLLGMGRECERCLIYGHLHEPCGCDNGWLPDSDTPAIDRLAMGRHKKADWPALVGCPDCRGREGSACRRCKGSLWVYALPTSPCELCDEWIYGVDMACPGCDGTGRKPDHEWQPPRDWSPGATCPECDGNSHPPLSTSRDWHGPQPKPCVCNGTGVIAHGPGVGGLRTTMVNVGGGSLPIAGDETDYPCGDHPDAEDDEAWRASERRDYADFKRRPGRLRKGYYTEAREAIRQAVAARARLTRRLTFERRDGPGAQPRPRPERAR